ncbi:uncharacterized protein Dmoj_GI26540 [Drosophila mojavensis]|uniref:Uncharacterized protein n=1 Tax=Drosophila mojavensis TaxID=7230 RepID=A0A0Q9WUE2_DROMO|nr:uncharacterized protein Dmoj_GI26540 [Drosophila mojavensis]
MLCHTNQHMVTGGQQQQQQQQQQNRKHTCIQTYIHT